MGPNSKFLAGAVYSGLNRLECESDHLPPPITVVKNAWKFVSVPL
jgi:hypothetical protein